MISLKAIVWFAALVGLSLPSVIIAEVIVLTEETFEHQTQASTGQTTGKWFVKFYAPWCGHCKRLEPVWDELSEKAAETPDDGIIVAKVDCPQNRAICKRFSIKGFPTLIYFAERAMYEYSGDRDVDSLLLFAQKGYKDAESSDVPGLPGWLEEMITQNEYLKNVKEDFEHILEMRKDAAALLIAVGLLFGIALGSIMGGWGKERKEKKD